MSDDPSSSDGAGAPATMHAVRLHAPGGAAALRLDPVPVPAPAPGEALVQGA